MLKFIAFLCRVYSAAVGLLASAQNTLFLPIMSKRPLQTVSTVEYITFCNASEAGARFRYIHMSNEALGKMSNSSSAFHCSLYVHAVLCKNALTQPLATLLYLPREV